MVELELTNVMPGARALALGNGGPEGVTEIPLGDSVRPGRPSAPAQQSQHERRPERPPKSGRATKRRSSARDSGRESAARPVSGRSAREELARTPLFGSLEPPALHRLMSEVRVVRLAAGEVLFREGDPANALYVVVEGAVVPIAEGSTRKRMAVLEQGEFFGEIGLVTNQPRNATIEGLVDTRLLAIDRRTMWSLVRGHAEMSKVLLRFLRQRLIDRHIGTNPFFAAFARDDRSAMAGLFRFLEVKDGSAVVEQGAPSEGLFVLLAGELDVIDEVAEKHRGSLEPGDLFGGITLIGGAPATASVVANGKCWVLALSEVRFRRILKENPRLEAQLKRLASQAGGDPHLV
jgi:CRP-like cAMP-binding protein